MRWFAEALWSKAESGAWSAELSAGGRWFLCRGASVWRRILRDVLPTLLMLLVTGSLTLLIGNYIAETRNEHTASEQPSKVGEGMGSLREPIRVK